MRSFLHLFEDDIPEPNDAYAPHLGPPPKKTLKLFKLFNVNSPGELYPLFIGAEVPIPQGVWVDAVVGPPKIDREGNDTGQTVGKGGKPYSKRPAWHAGEYPLMAQVGVVNTMDDSYPLMYASNQVMAQVLLDGTVDLRTKNGPDGKPLVGPNGMKEVPLGGFYTMPPKRNMPGRWFLSGSMKIVKIMTQREVNTLLAKHGLTPKPWQGGQLDLKSLGF
jgi:hypothetical protein